jgi:hypothetical protein
MSPAKPDPAPDLICWECGATNRADARKCWLCGRRSWRPAPVVIGGKKPPAPPGTWADRAATALASIVGVAVVYVFVTFVLPVLTFLAMVISALIALFQVCSAMLNAPR